MEDMLKQNVFNGFTENRKPTNAHFSYKGRSVIIDYEWILHCYSDEMKEQERVVPIEMYPYNGDIYWDYVECDEKWKYADMCKLIELLDKALDEETNSELNDKVLK